MPGSGKPVRKWRGVPITEMSRERLIAALEEAMRSIDNLQDTVRIAAELRHKDQGAPGGR